MFQARIFPRAAMHIQSNGLHLHVVIYADDGSGGCLLAPISSIKEGRFFDPACLLLEGDHECINRPSYVCYNRLMERAEHVKKMLLRHEYIRKEPVSAGLYDRILNGIFTSDEIRPSMVRQVVRAGLGQPARP